MNELKQWTKQIAELIDEYGWVVTKKHKKANHISIMSTGGGDAAIRGSGFGRVLFICLRTTDDPPNSHDLEWIDQIRSFGGYVQIWSPKDWMEAKACLRAG